MIVTFSARSLALIQYELSLFPDLETGGILLGHIDKSIINVIEAIDGGFDNAVRKTGSFQYDSKYVEHVANHVRILYNPPLELVGVWHKHNHSLDPGLSFSDESIGREMRRITNQDCISVLFQKHGSFGEEYLVKVFQINSKFNHVLIEQDSIVFE